ncbi:hypothetical protein CPT_Moabite_184 [Serratia phage Moabite]|uniref:Uncharacterized protein n=2 Tax=Moabitevirus moabite TaxID=2846181 RepID=A0A7T3NBF4_9CAUD|nr:hypothetical protein HWC48_gp232 [Serratia phage Moabite]QDB71214.1 hypothetical protein CPT_Moabite_184 [Serratia phage Moabite]QPX76639.1 hypothetical protein [Serratia phage vB_SmaM_Yaphecito]UQT03580.1 hypothetical protein KODAMA_01130 [Serratia phage vB_SmaM-Kodama]
MAIEAGIYDDPKLPCVIQAINPAAPWTKTPRVVDFVGETKPWKSIPIISWVIQYREVDFRKKLADYLVAQNKFGDPVLVRKAIMDLPDNSVNSTLGNIFYGVTTLAAGMLRPRLDNQMTTSAPATYQLWLAYYMAEMFAAELEGKDDNESRYRRKEMLSTREVVGYTMRQALTRNPNINWGNKVILDATDAIEVRDTLYCNRAALDVYLSRGGTLNTLGADWLTKGTNPTV